jgi:hypothetical protein
MNTYICMACHKPSYSSAAIQDLYFPHCQNRDCKGQIREQDTSGLELAVLIEQKEVIIAQQKGINPRH